MLVERSAALRARHGDGLPLTPPAEAFAGARGADDEGDDEGEGSDASLGIGPLAVSLGELPAVRFTGVVLANELLDNLPVRSGRLRRWLA